MIGAAEWLSYKVGVPPDALPEFDDFQTQKCMRSYEAMIAHVLAAIIVLQTLPFMYYGYNNSLYILRDEFPIEVSVKTAIIRC